MNSICINEMIKNKRKISNMSQEELSFDICSVSTLSRIENGIEEPSLNNLEKILERMGEEFAYYNSEDSTEKRRASVKRREYIEERFGKGSKGYKFSDSFTVNNKDNLCTLFIEYLAINESTDVEDMKLIKYEQLLDKFDIKKTKEMRKLQAPEPIELAIQIDIAQCLLNLGNSKKSKDGLKSLKDYLEVYKVYDDLVEKLYIKVLLLLSEAEMQSDRIDEALLYCSLAENEMDICNVYSLLPDLLKIRASLMRAKGDEELMEKCNSYLHVLNNLVEDDVKNEEMNCLNPIFSFSF